MGCGCGCGCAVLCTLRSTLIYVCSSECDKFSLTWAEREGLEWSGVETLECASLGRIVAP